MDLYEAIPMPDGDPLEHLIITVVLLGLWWIVMWIYYKIKDFTN